MIFNFKTVQDYQQWQIDTENGTWARASNIIAAPTVIAAAQNIARFVPQEEGKITPLGGGRYALTGRQPFLDGQPQLAVICILTLLSADNDGTCLTLIQGNVPLKELQHQPIKNFAMECLPPLQLTKAPQTKNDSLLARR